MTECVCALCGEMFMAQHPGAVVCDPCGDNDRVKVQRRLALHEIVSYAVNAHHAARTFAKTYPEAAALVQRIDAAITAELPALSSLVRGMQGDEEQRRAKVYAAREAR